MKKLFVTMIVVSLALAGCAADPNNPNSGVAQGTGEGAGVGAVAGLAICALVKCSHDQYVLAAAVGATVGGTVGYSLAKDVEKRRKALAGKENNLDARLIYVRGLNTDTEKFNQQFKNDTVVLQRQMDIGKRNGQSLEQQQTQINTQVKNANTQIASLDYALTDMKKYRAQPSTPTSPALDSEIGRLETLLAEAKTNTTSMASLRQRI